MKKLFITLMLLSSLSIAQTPNETIEKYLHNRDIVLQILGAADLYIERCDGLTELGGQYYALTMEIHSLTKENLAKESLYETSYTMISQYESCQAMTYDFSNLGIAHFFKVPV
jgi:hypothetical protein